MVNNADFIVELIFMLTMSRTIFWCTLFTNLQSNIKVHIVGSMFFVGFKSLVHLKDFQLRGWRWVYHVGMSSVSTVG